LKVEVSAMKDAIQESNGLKMIPEIRVWHHPLKAGRKGQDCYVVCESFKEAIKHIGSSDDAEEHPLIAFKGWELDIFTIPPAFKKMPLWVLAYFPAHGHSHYHVECSICGEVFTAYAWSIHGCGKRCPECGHLYSWMDLKNKEDENHEEKRSD